MLKSYGIRLKSLIINFVIFFVLFTTIIGINISGAEQKTQLSLAIIFVGVLEAINTFNSIRDFNENNKNSKIHVGVKTVSTSTTGIPKFILNDTQRKGFHIFQCSAPDNNQFFIPLVLNDEAKPTRCPVNFELFFQSSSMITKLAITKVAFSVGSIVQRKEFQSECAIIERDMNTDNVIKLCFLLPMDTQMRKQIVEKPLNFEIQLTAWNSAGDKTINVLDNILSYTSDNITLISNSHKIF